MNPSTKIKTLFYGYGNPGRQDDGLGVALAKRLEDTDIDGLEYAVNYQLNIEDAYEISRYNAVIFADASVEAEEPFEFKRVLSSRDIAFTTHAMPASSVVALCEELFNKAPAAYILAIRGYEWDTVEALSMNAAANLEKAFDFVISLNAQSSLESMECAAAEITGKKVMTK